jgi:hypothetical protein
VVHDAHGVTDAERIVQDQIVRRDGFEQPI